MPRNNPLYIIFTIIIYSFIIYLLIGLFITLLPFLVVFVIIGALIIGVFFIIGYFRSNLIKPQNPKSEFDEFGSRRIKSTIIEMKDSESQNNADEKKEDAGLDK